MDTIPLGQSDLQVTPICLGTMTFGEQVSEQDAHAILDRALERGLNFIDTAEMYAVPARAATYGATESIIGRWLASRPGARSRIVLASKVAGPSRGMPWIREGSGMTAADIRASCEASLRRLQTDCIDLYQIHWPERHVPVFGQLYYEPAQETTQTSIHEQLQALAALVQAGKVRHIGLSNETPWGTMTFLRLAEERGWPRAVSIQNPYNLLNRSFEVGLAEIAIREQCGLLAYSPMAFGMLSGKYADGARPANARISLYSRFTRYTNPQAEAACARYVALAREHGMEPAQMALAYVTSRPFVTSNIIGATSLEQLETNLGSIDLRLDEEVLAGIDAIHREQPNPAP